MRRRREQKLRGITITKGGWAEKMDRRGGIHRSDGWGGRTCYRPSSSSSSGFLHFNYISITQRNKLWALKSFPQTKGSPYPSSTVKIMKTEFSRRTRKDELTEPVQCGLISIKWSLYRNHHFTVHHRQQRPRPEI